ncbi:MAG TPA: carboxypeptidase regulatory-like domain-containing protein, partial [Nannocystis exedens]|nr:carboxypeptidase regulatory-like domain-containing protein [Nannocystis exedens]
MPGQGSPSFLSARARVVVVLVLGAVVSLGGVLALHSCPPAAETPKTKSRGATDSARPLPPMIHEGVVLHGSVRVEDSPLPPPDPDGSARGSDESRGGATTTTGEAEGSTGASRATGEELRGVLRPPRSCTVIAWSAGRQLGAPVHCGRDGSYELRLTKAPAEVAIEILVPGHLRAVLVAAPRSGESVELPIVALGPALDLSGQVIDPRGQPVVDVQLQARPRPDLGEPEPWRTKSLGDGGFSWDTLPAGPIEIRAEKRGYAPTIVDVIAPEDGIIVVLEGLRDLSGEVLGTPEQLARTVVRIEGSSIWPPIEVEVEADGSFQVPQIPDGVYGLVAEAPAGQAGDREYASIPLENVSPDMQVSLALIEAVRVPVEVRDPSGAAIEGARVT